jgi:hypothetical protein
VVSSNYRNRPSEAQTTSATIKVQTIRARSPWRRENFDWDPLFSFELLLDLFLASHGRKERYLIVACTVITDVPEAVGP